MARESTERAIERVAVALIKRELGGASTFPVLRSDETPATADFRAIIVEATREAEPIVIDEADVKASTRSYDLKATLRGFNPAGEADTESERWNAIENALRSTSATGIDLARFDVFHVFAEGASETDQDEDGRRILARTYRVAIEEVEEA